MQRRVKEVHYGKKRDVKHHEKRNYINKCGEQKIVFKMEVGENDRCVKRDLKEVLPMEKEYKEIETVRDTNKHI